MSEEISKRRLKELEEKKWIAALASGKPITPTVREELVRFIKSKVLKKRAADCVYVRWQLFLRRIHLEREVQGEMQNGKMRATALQIVANRHKDDDCTGDFFDLRVSSPDALRAELHRFMEMKNQQYRLVELAEFLGL